MSHNNIFRGSHYAPCLMSCAGDRQFPETPLKALGRGLVQGKTRKPLPFYRCRVVFVVAKENYS